MIENKNWAMPSGNPQRTNCITSPNLDRGLVIILEDIMEEPYEEEKRRIRINAYNFYGEKEWEFEKKTDWEGRYQFIPVNGNILLTDLDCFEDGGVEISAQSGKVVRRINFNPLFIYNNTGVERGSGVLRFRKYPSGEMIYEKRFLDEAVASFDEKSNLLGIINNKAVIDCKKKFLILDVNNPEKNIIKKKEMGANEKMSLVNMDENGIVGSYYSKNASSSMDNQRLGGRSPDVFSSLVYLGFDGKLKWDPFEFGLHVFPEGMPLINGRVYLDVGQLEHRGMKFSSLYCFDLENREVLWKRYNGGLVIPTEEVVYTNSGEIAVDGFGKEIWKFEKNMSIRVLTKLVLQKITL